MCISRYPPQSISKPGVRHPLLPRPVRWAFVALVVITIFVGSVILVPPDPTPGIIPFWDNQLHFAAYASLALALAYGTGDAEERRSLVQILTLFLVTVAYGASIEAVQFLPPERHPSLADALANGIGAFAVFAWVWLESRFGYVPVGWPLSRQ